MLSSHIAKKVLDEALSLGATFAELFVEQNEQFHLKSLKGKVDKVTTGRDFGIGVRLLFGTKVLYGHTNSIQEDELLRITRLLAELSNTKKGGGSLPESLMALDFRRSSFPNRHQVTMGLDKSTNVPLREKVSFLQDIERSTRDVSDKIIQTSADCMQKLQKILLFNSEGLEAQDERNYIRLSAVAVASDGSGGHGQSVGSDGPGALQGWEFVHTIDPKELGERVAKQAITMLYAKPCPARAMPVIIANGFGGVIFHEACGHILETTSVEKKASIFHDKMGEMIASPCVTAIDDGTLGNAWGSANIDDEGMPTQKVTLIEEGRLKSFLVDRVGHLKTGYARTGSGRRESYRFAPASRMSNTYIQAGPYKIEDMISSVDYGLFAKTMGGGSVSPGTGEFNFSVKEAYLIEKGKITEPLRGATLIGKGSDILKQISMVGNDLKLAPGVCGSVSGSVPVNVGQPSIKVDNILVGGKGQ